MNAPARHLGTFRAAAYRHATTSYHSLTHALISGITMAGALGVFLFWVAGV